jgi:mannose-6-phosphate isomerase-like protein (cupin superfamily)
MMTAKVPSHHLSSTFLRLRNDASVEPLPVDAQFWQRIASGALGTFQNEFLVTMTEYQADWPHWEMHPNGDEIVCLLSGAARFILEIKNAEQEIDLARSGSFVLVPKGTWHTARIAQASQFLFITAGEGTQHRRS